MDSEVDAGDPRRRVWSTIMQWNPNGVGNKKPEVKQYIKAYDPLVVVLSEPRSQLELAGYSSFESKPSDGTKQKKLNCQILVKGANDFVEVLSTVNCLAILSEVSMSMPALVVAVYLHPDDAARNQ